MPRSSRPCPIAGNLETERGLVFNIPYLRPTSLPCLTGQAREPRQPSWWSRLFFLEETASPLRRTLADVGLSFCSPCGTNRGLYFALEFDSCPLRKHDRDHHNNRRDRHQSPASSTLLETTPTHSKNTGRGFGPPFLGHKLRVGASRGFPLYGAIYSYLPRRTQAKGNGAHTKAK